MLDHVSIFIIFFVGILLVSSFLKKINDSSLKERNKIIKAENEKHEAYLKKEEELRKACIELKSKKCQNDVYLYYTKLQVSVVEFHRTKVITLNYIKNFNKALNDMLEYSEHSARLNGEIKKIRRSFEKKAALLPVPVTNKTHLDILFAEYFQSLPISRDPHISKYSYGVSPQERVLMKLPEPLPMPDLPDEPNPKVPLTPQEIREYNWGIPPCQFDFDTTWGTLDTWVLIDGVARPSSAFSRYIPTGPNDPIIFEMPLFIKAKYYGFKGY